MKYAPEYAFIGNIVGGRKGDGIAAGVAAGGTLSGMGPVSNLNPRYEAGHMLATFYPLIALLPNGKRFYCETAVHNAATGCLAAGYNEWYSIWDNTAQNGIDQEVIARELARGTGRKDGHAHRDREGRLRKLGHHLR